MTDPLNPTIRYPEWRSKRKCKGKRDASLKQRANRRKSRRAACSK